MPTSNTKTATVTAPLTAADLDIARRAIEAVIAADRATSGDASVTRCGRRTLAALDHHAERMVTS